MNLLKEFEATLIARCIEIAKGVMIRPSLFRSIKHGHRLTPVGRRKLFQLRFVEYDMLAHFGVVFAEGHFFGLFLGVLFLHVKRAGAGAAREFYKNDIFLSHDEDFPVKLRRATYAFHAQCQAVTETL